MTLFYVNIDVTQINASIGRNVQTIISYFCKKYRCTYHSANGVYATYLMPIYLGSVIFVA